MKAKYVVVQHETLTHCAPCAIVFDPIVVHASIVRALERLAVGERSERPRVLGAGFVELYANTSYDHGEDSDVDVTVSGESESLGVKSRPEDEAIVRRALGLS